MGSAAEVGEMAVGVVCDGTVLKLADELALVLVSLLLEMLHGFRLGDIDPGVILLLAGELKHPLLYLREVSVRDLVTSEIDIIIETILDGRSDTELDSGEQVLKSLSHKVR